MQGKFIVFEGGEGSGKTTQIQHIQKWLATSGWLARSQSQGYLHPLVVTREPGGTEVCQKIRHLLLGEPGQEIIHHQTELLLYAADRAQHVSSLLQPQLAAGALILCDRYTDSTIAYQGYGRGLSLDLITQLNQIATNGLESDLTFWLDLPVETGLARTQKRGAADRIEQADLGFHQRVRAGFAKLARQQPQRIVMIDANCSEAAVTAQIQVAFERKLSEWLG
jgi:dTMP kinase